MRVEDILRLVEILAWPATALVTLFVLRTPISRLLLLVERIRYKDLDVEFRKGLENAERDAGQIANEPAPETKDADLVLKLVEVSPPAAVLEAWKRLENAARAKVRELLPEGETFRDPLVRPVDYLDLKGAFIPSIATAARNLHMLRNQAAHASSAQISREDALRYAELAWRVQAQIESIVELPRAKLTALTLLVLQLNSAIDSKRHEDITIDEVYGWIERREVLPKLAERVGDDIDLSLFGPQGPYLRFAEFYHEQLHSLWGGYGGQHRRKWGIENSGLCLLLAWTNEIIQQGSGWHPASD